MFLAAGNVFAQVAVLTDDAHVRNTVKEAGTNFGTNPSLLVVPGSPAHLKFNLVSVLPASTPGTAIEKATLRLYLSNVTVAGSLEIHALADSWDEKSITANNAPLLAIPLGTTEPIDLDSRFQFLVLDVTAAVRQWLGDDGLGANGLPNHGLAIASPGAAQVSFDSKENSQTSHEPELLIQVRGSSGGGIASVDADAPLLVTNATTTPTISLGIVPAANGGTGLNAPGADGSFLRSAGGAWTSAPLSAGDLPDLTGSFIRNATASQAAANFNIGGTGTADVLNAATQFNLHGSRILTDAGTNNLFAGTEAGASNVTGSANAFFGRNAGQANTTGSSNSFAGFNAGAGNTTGGRNSFFGDAAGFRNAGANDNAFFGFLAGFHTTASANSYFGSLAGADNTAGSGNSFFGMNAGVHNTSGSGNSFFGLLAGASNTTSFGNSYFGSFAGVNTTGSLNSFVGGDAGFNNTTGSDNSFVGYKAGYSNISGSGNSFFGRGAGFGSTTGNNVTLVGAQTIVGSDNLGFATAIGAGAVVNTSNTVVLGRAADTVRVPGALNIGGSFSADIVDAATQFNLEGRRMLTANGPFSQSVNVFPATNTFVGEGAGRNTTPDPDPGSGFGKFNSFFGVNAGAANTTGRSNSFFGSRAGESNTSGGFNAFFGPGAGLSNTTGLLNAFFGQSAGQNTTTGEQNAFFGGTAGSVNTTGSSNLFLGSSAGGSNTTGSRNVFVGSVAGIFSSTGNDNTFVGSGASFDSFDPIGDNHTLLGARTRVATGLSSSSAIGYGALVTQSNSLVLGGISGVNGGSDTNVGIGTTAPQARLEVRNGNILVGSPGQGIILKSPDGATCRLLSVDNAGNLVLAALACQ